MSTTENPIPTFPCTALPGLTVSGVTLAGRPVTGQIEAVVDGLARIGGYTDVPVSQITELWVVGTQPGSFRSIPIAVEPCLEIVAEAV